MAGVNADNGYLAYLDAVKGAIGKVGYMNEAWFLAMGNSLAVECLIPEGFWRKWLKETDLASEGALLILALTSGKLFCRHHQAPNSSSSLRSQLRRRSRFLWAPLPTRR